jgi:SAM-dependent methyltransferase
VDNFQEKIDLYSDKKLTERKIWYSDVARSYDRFRPRYLQTTIERLIDLTSLSPQARILEIGCGPATATRVFAVFGYPMVCLEPNPAFFYLAKNNCQAYSQVEIINTSLEEWQLEMTQFDLAISATAFHWIPAEIGYPKVAQALKANSYFILLWNGQLLPNPEISESLVEIYQKYAPSLIAWEDIQIQRESLFELGKMLPKSGFFTSPIYEEEIIKTVYNVEDYLLLLSTYSPYIALDAASRQNLFAALRDKLERDWGKDLELSYVSAFHLAQKK